MVMASSASPICFARMRRLWNTTLVMPETVRWPLRRVPFGEQAARLHRHRGEALHLEALAADVGRIAERGLGVALDRRQRDDVIACRSSSNSTLSLRARGVAVGHRRQRLDVERDGVERVLGQRRAVGHHHGDRLADVAHLAVAITGCW